MNLGKAFHKGIKYLSDHSGTICAGLAVAGVGVTAYFSGKAAVRVDHEIDCDMDKSLKIKTYIKAYWKTAVSGLATCGLIIGSDRLHVRKEVVLAGVAAIWKRNYTDLDKAMTEEVGQEKAKEIHQKMMDDRMANNTNIPDLPEDADSNYILVYEPYTDQYIWTTREKILHAMYEANMRLVKDMDVRLSVIIDYLGGTPTLESEEIGWNYDNESQEYAWAYYGGPWIDLLPDIYRNIEDDQPIPTTYRKMGDPPLKGDALCLFYTVDPEEQTPENMIYCER